MRYLMSDLLEGPARVDLVRSALVRGSIGLPSNRSATSAAQSSSTVRTPVAGSTTISGPIRGVSVPSERFPDNEPASAELHSIPGIVLVAGSVATMRRLLLRAGRLQRLVAGHESVPLFLSEVATYYLAGSLDPAHRVQGNLKKLARRVHPDRLGGLVVPRR